MPNDYFIEFADKLRTAILQKDNLYLSAAKKAEVQNPWFTQREVDRMVDSICEYYLNPISMHEWLDKYPGHSKSSKTIGLIAAGNIPLVAFHDILCILASGNKLQVKLSEKDEALNKWLFELIHKINPTIYSNIQIVNRLEHFDAVIATGNNQSSNIFRQYFGNYPHIIRGHRNSVAVLTGNETSEEILTLASDIFAYYGLGCRNISKLYVPNDFTFDNLFNIFDAEYEYLMEHTKYFNNYEYQLAILLLNQKKFYQAKSLLLYEDDRIASPLACLHIERFKDIQLVKENLAREENKIQCVIGNVKEFNCISPGQGQKPKLDDYADNLDTMYFLTNL